MHLRKLIARNVRILADVELTFDADLVVLSGANGSGKTSLLEAIHLLGTARSFRARTVQDVVARGSDALLVRGEFSDASTGTSSAGVEKQRRGGTALRLCGAEVRTASELARHLPLVTITPDSQRLLSDGAEARRRLLDWLLFHVEPGYHAAHSRYRRVLLQRNAALRRGTAAAAEREAWSSQLAAAARVLEGLRREALGRSLPHLEAAVGSLSALPVLLEYAPGWDTDGDLGAALLREWDRDTARGFTTLGPHRADLRVKLHGRPAQHVLSRGEGKVLMAALLAGCARVLAERVSRRPLLLVDELASELDADNRRGFSRVLRELGMQTFITAVSEQLVDTAGWARVAVFRMDRGRVVQMLE
jgi:DNA replication and repair protein RecF